MAVIEDIYKSNDDVVRKVKVAVMRENTRTMYVRPISQLVKMLEVK